MPLVQSMNVNNPSTSRPFRPLAVGVMVTVLSGSAGGDATLREILGGEVSETVSTATSALRRSSYSRIAAADSSRVVMLSIRTVALVRITSFVVVLRKFVSSNRAAASFLLLTNLRN